MRRGIIEKQHHEIKQCIQRIRPVDNLRKAYLFFSNFQIDGLKVDQKINCQEWVGEELSPQRRQDCDTYYQLAKGVVDKLRFYAVKFQSDTELRNRLIRNDELGQGMEHLCQGSKYGKSFSKLNGNRISRDLKQSLEELELKESRLKIFRNWKEELFLRILTFNSSSESLTKSYSS